MVASFFACEDAVGWIRDARDGVGAVVGRCMGSGAEMRGFRSETERFLLSLRGTWSVLVPWYSLANTADTLLLPTVEATTPATSAWAAKGDDALRVDWATSTGANVPTDGRPRGNLPEVDIVDK